MAQKTVAEIPANPLLGDLRKRKRKLRVAAYRKGSDGEPEIVPEEAKIIRLITQNYLNSDSLRTIKETLESMGVPTATGNQNWSTEAIQRILQNEKYMGDVLLQKTYTADFMEGKVKKNNGELLFSYRWRLPQSN